MNKGFYILLIVIFLCRSFLNDKVSGQGDIINAVKTLELRAASFNKNYDEIEGNPYYTKDFTRSVAYLKDGNYATIPLRYDMFRDEMEFKREAKTLWLIKKDIKYIKYGTEILFVLPVNGDTAKLGYFFIKDTGKYQLLYRKSVSYIPYVEPKGYVGSTADKFEGKHDEIFIKKENEPMVKIKTKKDLQSFFSNDKVALEFIKKKRIKADNIINLHVLINYLNGL